MTTGETLFSLAYGIEAMILVEFEQKTYRPNHFLIEENDLKLKQNLDSWRSIGIEHGLELSPTNKEWQNITTFGSASANLPREIWS